MGKITVKHYLNTRVNPLKLGDDKEYYPIYVQVTNNRKTTQIKSFTNVFSTMHGIETYLNTGIFDKEEIFEYPNSDIIVSLSNEVRIIELGMKYITNTKIDVSQNGHELREVLEVLFAYMSDILVSGFKPWIMSDKIDDDSKLVLYNVFNHCQTISSSIEKIKDKTKIDLSGFIEREYWELSKDIDNFIKYIGENTIYIDFINSKYDLKSIPNMNNIDAFEEYLNYIISMQTSEYDQDIK